MKILIIGAGVVGSIFGWALTAGGQDVTHFIRQGRFGQFKKGMRVDLVDRRPNHKKHTLENYPIKVTETILPEEHFDLIIVPTKHYTLEQTLQQVVPLTKGSDYLLLTQNWQGTEEIDQWIDPAHYCFGDAKAGGSFIENTLTCTIKAIDIGSSNRQTNSSLQKCVSLFRSSDIPVFIQSNMLHYLWVQYAYTGGPWPMLVRAGSFKKLYTDPQVIKPIMSAIKESLLVVQARGVDLNQFPDVQMYLHPSALTQLLSGVMLSWMFSHDEYRKRCSLHALSDPQEVRTFYFDLLNTGQTLGVPMPVMKSYLPDMENFTQPGSAW
jgi:ketopantoate reductase